MQDSLCEVAYHEDMGHSYYRIGLRTGWRGFVPGQFGMLEVPRADGILLRRPFSFARQQGDVTEIFYKKVGKGTEALSLVGVGRSLRLLGPLGQGFRETSSAGEGVGVAGGYGIAPFVQMAKQLKAKGRRLQLFYGARSKQDLFYIQEFKELEVKLYISTEDGSEGLRGRVTDLLDKTFANSPPERIWSCGPMGLLKAVQNWSQRKKTSCELSVEETMGCGTGVCLGCVVQDVQGHYRRACIEGPVFPGELLNLTD